MPKVFRLGYYDIGSANIASKTEYYTDVLGASVVERGSDGTIYLSLGLDHHNIAVSPAKQHGLQSLGFQLTPDTLLQDLAADLAAAGLHGELKSDARPGVAQLLEVVAPGDSVVQFFSEMTAVAPGFSEKGVGPLQLGHVALITREAAAMAKFYRELLGFWRTDWITGHIDFLTCNSDHHVINIVDAPHAKMHHVAFELRDTAHHSIAADLLMRHKVQTVWGPSRHPPGHNIAAYHYDPDRQLVELYSDLDVYVPELDACRPRPWHEDLPQRPKDWPMPVPGSAWGVEFGFDMRTA